MDRVNFGENIYNHSNYEKYILYTCHKYHLFKYIFDTV